MFLRAEILSLVYAQWQLMNDLRKQYYSIPSLYNRKNSSSGSKKVNFSCYNKESQYLTQFSGVSQFTLPELFPKGNCSHLPESMLWGKGNNQTFHTNSQGGPKVLWPAVQSGDLQCSGNTWSLSSSCTHSGSRGSADLACAYFPSSLVNNWSRHTG